MCALFGFVNYGRVVSQKHLKELVRRLAVESEIRGIDASGIAYVRNGEIVICKKPKPAHKVRFCFPENVTVLTGHTRMTTQGNAEFNYNNHPFAGETANGHFALCHNGVLYNDDVLKKQENLPKTHIQTDSYVAVQLIEKYGSLNFETIAKMSEAVRGSFVFTVLSDNNTLYISKGDNPLCLLHFKQLRLYVYTSTTAIMQEVLNNSVLENQPFKMIAVDEGEIISINQNGKLDRSKFDLKDYELTEYHRYMSYYDDISEDSYLFEYCNTFGLSQEDLMMLYEMGYCDEDIELMLMDNDMLQSSIQEARAYFDGYYEGEQNEIYV